MKRARICLTAALIVLLSLQVYATENAFMAFDVDTQKMFAVVVGDNPEGLRAEVVYTQSNPGGWVGPVEDPLDYPIPNQVWAAAGLCPQDAGRQTDLDPGEINVISAVITIYNEYDEVVNIITREDTLVADAGGYNYTYLNDNCVPVLPDTIRIGTSFCAFLCHGSYTIPIFCEDPGYNPDLLEITVTNGCDPAQTHCNVPECPRIDWSQFAWFKRVRPGCRLYLTMTYCIANPGCVCIWRSDFYLPAEMGGFTATGGDGLVRVNWSTLSETNTEKFIVTRSAQRDGIYTTVHSTDAAGTSAERHNYAWVDTDVANGVTYYYKLHTRGVDGSLNVYAIDGETVIASATPAAGLPSDYSLSQNYPNPFNSATTFNFTIPVADHVTLKVFDLLGREVATVLDRNLTADNYSINWSAEGLATGVYMYTLTSGSFSKSMKMLYLK